MASMLTLTRIHGSIHVLPAAGILRDAKEKKKKGENNIQ